MLVRRSISFTAGLRNPLAKQPSNDLDETVRTALDTKGAGLIEPRFLALCGKKIDCIDLVCGQGDRRGEKSPGEGSPEEISCHRGETLHEIRRTPAVYHKNTLLMGSCFLSLLIYGQ